MCNTYELKVEWPALQAAIAEAGLALARQDAPSAPPPEIRVNDPGPIVRAHGNGVEVAPARWGFPPPRPRAAPVFNFRSENRDFAASHRCLIPASAFFEFTGTRPPKSKWRFDMPGHPVFALAGLWRPAAAAGEADCFTMLTTPPGADVAPFHDRQVVALAPPAWPRWLYLDGADSPLAAMPGGSLRVSLVRAGRDPVPDALHARSG